MERLSTVDAPVIVPTTPRAILLTAAALLAECGYTDSNHAERPEGPFTVAGAVERAGLYAPRSAFEQARQTYWQTIGRSIYADLPGAPTDQEAAIWTLIRAATR